MGYEEPTAEEEIRAAIAALVDAKEEISTLRSFFETEHPDEWAKLSELERGISSKQDAAKNALRTIGKNSTIMGYSFKITTPTSKKVDIGAMLARAKDRGELFTLLEYGVLTYDAVPDQIERLPDLLKAIYSGYVTEKKETPRVTLPTELK